MFVCHDVYIPPSPFIFFLCFISHDRIVKSLDKLVEKQKMTMEYANNTLGRIEFTTDMDALKETDLIVEAIVENMSFKEELYTNLGQLCQPNTIFASNTSSLSITEMAAFSGRPDKFVGVHFFNPVQVRYDDERMRLGAYNNGLMSSTVK
jgi:3-hydroxyacyl-CoA dehydrogenase